MHSVSSRQEDDARRDVCEKDAGVAADEMADDGRHGMREMEMEKERGELDGGQKMESEFPVMKRPKTL